MAGNEATTKDKTMKKCEGLDGDTTECQGNLGEVTLLTGQTLCPTCTERQMERWNSCDYLDIELGIVFEEGEGWVEGYLP